MDVFDSCQCGTTYPQLNSVNSVAKLRNRSVCRHSAASEFEHDVQIELPPEAVQHG
jgi:hypothetical protein